MKNLFKKLLAVVLVGAMLSTVGCNDYDDDIDALNQRIDEIEGSQIKTINDQIASMEGSIMTLQGAIDAVDAALETLEAKQKDLADVEAAQAQEIADLTAKLEEQKSNLEAQITAINATIESLPTKEWCEATYATLAQMQATSAALGALQGVVDGLKTNIAGLEGDIDKLETTVADMDTKIANSIDDLKNWITDEVLAPYATQEFVINQLATWVYPDIDTLKEQMADVQELLGNVDVEGAIAKAIEKNNGVIEQKVADQVAAINAKLDAMSAQLRGALVNIDELMNRIQSLVYVPEYDDHKATVTALYVGEELLAEGRVTMEFRVTPVSAAQQLVDFYNANEANKAIFKLEGKAVQTRAAEDFGLTIMSIEAAEEAGHFVVTASSHLPESFYSGANSYSTALRLEKAYDAESEAEKEHSADVVSDYVNLVLERSLVEEVVMISETDTLHINEVLKYEIAYDDLEAKVALLEGYELAVLIENTYTKLSEIDFSMEATEAVCENQAYLKNNTAAELEVANFAVADTEEACDEVVSLVKLDKYSVGNYLASTHTFTNGPLEATFSTEVDIIKAYKTVTFEDWTYYWWYQDYLTAKEAQVEYVGSMLKVVLPVKESLLPEDITPTNVVDTWSSKPVTVAVDGEESEMTVTPVAYDEEKGYTLEITGWNFAEQAQLIEATCEFAAIDLKFVINANFINLPTQIAAEIAPATLTYDNTLDVFVSAGEAVVEPLYAQVENHFTDATEFASSLAKINANVTYNATLGEGEEATVVTNKKHTYLNKNASYTMIRVKNDGLMTSVMEVLKSDVTAAGDTFNFSTILAPAYGELAIEVTGAATIEAPAYAVKHNDVWVAYNAENGSYYSNVKGLWMPDGKLSPISSFSTENVALEEAFEIVKIVDGQMVAVSAEEIEAQGLILSFALDAEYEGISITDNLMTYNGKEEKVGVDGELYVGELLIPTAFNEYENYEVFGYDPIGLWSVEAEDVISTETAKPQYSLNVIDKLSLKDVRGFELISENATDVVNPWIVGDDENGYVSQISPKEVFQLSDLVVTHRFVDAATGFDTDVLNGRVVVDDATGEITFNNLNNMALQKDVIVEVTVTLSYPWGEDKVGVVTYRITK